jgi:hypothetical protein
MPSSMPRAGIKVMPASPSRTPQQPWRGIGAGIEHEYLNRLAIPIRHFSKPVVEAFAKHFGRS